jgi:hypothetical protein
VTLGKIKLLADDLLKNNCTTCGMIPIRWPSEAKDSNSILKFDFVTNRSCAGSCIFPDDPVSQDTSTIITKSNEHYT